jgi:tetratricopeptide (TPR) repeat protein
MKRRLACGSFVCLALAGAVGCAKSTEQRVRLESQIMERETTPERLQARGEAAAMVGDLTRAEQYFAAAMKAGGDQRLLTTRLLVVCVADSRYPAAATYGEDYLHRHPTDPEIRYTVATIYVGLGDLGRARDNLREVIEERPDLADAHYALAQVLRDSGESLLDADKELHEYLRLSPTGQYAETARASLLKSVP